MSIKAVLSYELDETEGEEICTLYSVLDWNEIDCANAIMLLKWLKRSN
ncbi:19500_t:CDS:1, partial [Gigaspora rosea]